ncbi:MULTISPECIES: 8-oxo-dGTP diphosphatase [Allobaculum]|uniref:8-oxo-dGTP diphosphatase n=1 Tax=Allobaculum TaxID=174708 RepID=UPI001E5D644D|nr:MULTISPECIES: 8-oxo-dGTP diphosphatase [Allobaculum]UNT92575.1 8-oxo-dGTP diphosphatase [Allobaculum sp. Allo2]
MKHKLESCELTTICLLTRNDEILLQKRNKGEWDGWVFPGGHVEHGESFVHACKREVLEETGLRLRTVKLVGVKQFPHGDSRYIVFLFRSDDFEGSLISSEEGENRWFKRDELPEGLVMDFDLMLEAMDNDHLGEFQYRIEDGLYVPILFYDDKEQPVQLKAEHKAGS